MKRLWLIFAQSVTVALAMLFVVSTLHPEWLPNKAAGGGFGQNNGGNLGNNSGNNNAGKTAPTLELPAGTATLPPDTPRSMPSATFADASRIASQAVVNIYTTQNNKADARQEAFFRKFFGDRMPKQQREFSSLGSGVIVSGDGLILTNNHVVEAADSIEVLLADGRRTKATVVGTDPDSDLAVLKIALPNIPAIQMGDLRDVRVGDVVLAIGNPFGVGQTVTMGIVSALGRSHLGINTFENFIQTDAAINPGNSGGALTDSNGKLIGINTAIYSKDGGSLGIGFAVPVSTARMVLDSIVKNGKVTRGFIGVSPTDVTAEIAEELKLKNLQGSAIATVQKGSPADVAGMKPRDVVQSIGGAAVKDTVALLNLIAQTPPGSVTKIVVLRDGVSKELTVTVAERQKP